MFPDHGHAHVDTAGADTQDDYDPAAFDALVREHDRPPVEVTATHVLDGAAFILDAPAEMEARWGNGSAVAWARGESCMIVGPPGVGKTTLAGQLLAALVGIDTHVLGMPVQPARRVLYLAMDRPRQVRRAMARYFNETHRTILAARAVFHEGPLATGIDKVPDLLVQLARKHDCDLIVVDSLKDAAVRLTDDEVGGNVNRAIQLALVEGIDVLVLHHQTKHGAGGEGKPTSLANVYGSAWITAGAGSVFLLWGEPGSELVELRHLKQPADPIGPWHLEHDHHHGTTRIARGFDALAFLRLRSNGATVSEAAQAEHGAPQKAGSAPWKRTERRLRTLVRDELAHHQPQTAPGVESRYFAVDTTVDTPLLPGDGHDRGHHVDTP